MLDVPDHSGPPDDRQRAELTEALRRIDAERRLLIVPGARRVFRAAAAYDAGGAMEHYRELGLSVAEIAETLGMSDFEVRRLLMPGRTHLSAEARRRFRLG